MIYTNLTQLIGNTPLLAAERWSRRAGLSTAVLCKLEGFNPAGSAKDRVAAAMLDAAEREGRLQAGGTVIEPTSGNTGIGLAALCTARGYRLILTMPDSMSAERIALLRAYGAEVILTPGGEGMQGAIRAATELAEKTPGSFIPSQFDNPANPLAHYTTTGREIWADTEGRVDIFVAGVGTGGTLTGTGRFLKEQSPDCRIVAVEPASSPLLSEGRSGAHGLQGIGANFVPANFDRSICDEIIAVTEDEAYAAARSFAHTEGILVGISAGAALHAAAKLAALPENADKRIVVLLPDSGERYLSTGLFEVKN